MARPPDKKPGDPAVYTVGRAWPVQRPSAADATVRRSGVTPGVERDTP